MFGDSAGFSHRYLRLADLRRLEQMRLRPRKFVAGRFAGQYPTRLRGQGVEFRDYREYLPGDEIGAIDWKVYGRSDKLFVRLSEHQSEQTLHLLVDGSASMAYRGSPRGRRRGGESKYDFACRLAAALAFLAVRQHDRCALAIAGEFLHSQGPPDGTMRHLANLLRFMEQYRPAGRARLPEAIHEVSRSAGRRTLLVLFSDLWDDPDRVTAALAARVAHGGEAVVFHVLHPEEVHLPDREYGVLIDSETEVSLRVDVDDVRREYGDRVKRHLEMWSARCRAIGVDYVRGMTSDPYQRVLERFLVRRSAQLH